MSSYFPCSLWPPGHPLMAAAVGPVQTASLCPQPLLRQVLDPIYCVPKCRPCRPGSPRALFKGREVRGRPRLAHTRTTKGPFLAILSAPNSLAPSKQSMSFVWVKGPTLKTAHLYQVFCNFCLWSQTAVHDLGAH